VANKRECNGSPGRDKSKTDPASCAFGPKHLAPLLFGSIKNDKLKPAEAIVKLKEYCARELKYAFVKRVVKAAKVLAGIALIKGDDTDSVALLPCHVAALNALGWKASYQTCDAKAMHIQIVEMAKSAHERDENEKRKECQKNNEPFVVATRFNPSVIPSDLDDNRDYLLSYTLAPVATAPHL